MKRYIFRHTTSIEVEKTVGEINKLLMDVGATGIMIDAANGQPIGVCFRVPAGERDLAYRLPVNTASVFRAMVDQRIIADTQKGREQANRTAWRMTFEWLRAQAAFIDSAAVDAEQVFLPYLIVGARKTLYEIVKGSDYKALPAPGAHPHA